MDKETLSNYGWIVIAVLVLVVMIALAGPFGDFVANAVKSTTQGLFDVNQNALSAADINIPEQEFIDESTNVKTRTQLWNSTWTYGKGVNTGNGNLYTSTDYCISDFMTLSPNTEYVLECAFNCDPSISRGLSVYYYDSEYNYIEREYFNTSVDMVRYFTSKNIDYAYVRLQIGRTGAEQEMIVPTDTKLYYKSEY